MIFPQLGPVYYDESAQNRGILSLMEASYAESITIMQAYWAEADTDVRFMTGDQSMWSDVYGNLPINRRQQFSFNRIRRTINLIDGYQRRNRKSTVVVPAENGNDQTASEFTKVLMWVHDNENVLETISDAFRGGLVAGMNLLQVWLDYRDDPVSGKIRVDNCSYNSFILDPFFKKADLSDCNFIWKRSWLTKSECISLMPDHEDMIIGLMGNDNNRDGKFQFMPESYNYGMKNLLSYDEYYYRSYRTQRMLVDSKTGECTEWTGSDENLLKAFLAQYPEITVLKQQIPTVNLAISVQGRVLYDGPNPLGIDTYPFVPVFSYYTPETPYFEWRIQGVVRGLRDAQFLYNRRKAIELDILESQVNSGWKYKEDALVNPADIFLTGQGRGLALKSEAQMSDVERIEAPNVPQSMTDLSKILADEIQQISGVNEELLGSATDDKAGILSQLRQGAGLTTLQVLFDRLDAAQKLLGKLMINIIQTNFTPGKIAKILGHEPSQYFYKKEFGKYDAVVAEGLNTSTQKQMEFAQLLQLREAGVPIPDNVLVESCTLQNKDDLLRALEAQTQSQQQLAQQQMQMQQAAISSQIDLNQARAIADKGLGLERISRVGENQTLAQERLAQAHKEEEEAVLNKVKILKEIESLDFDHLERIIMIAQKLKSMELVEQPGVAGMPAVPGLDLEQIQRNPQPAQNSSELVR